MIIPRAFLALGLVLFIVFVGSLQPSASAAKDGNPAGIRYSIRPQRNELTS